MKPRNPIRDRGFFIAANQHRKPAMLPSREECEMSVLTLALQTAQAPTGAVPCRTHDGDYWFAEDVATTAKAQELCQTCPIKLACLTQALARKEPCGVWGGELFEHGQIVAGHKPKGRPRKDAQEVAHAAAARVSNRLAELSDALAANDPQLADLVGQAAGEVRVA
jgi:WhiB family redox-sensing transcriptional regulator